MKIQDNTGLCMAIKEVLCVDKKEKISFFDMNKTQLANNVYGLEIKRKKYVLKEYKYNYDFNLSELLYNIYKKNSINFLKPINKEIINIKGINYNIFNYLSSCDGIATDEFIINLVKIDRRVNFKSNLISKCDYYYNYLCNLNTHKLEETRKVLDEYSSIKDNAIFYDCYLNHGDISKSNLLFNNGIPYIIDFDEAVVTTELYDLAVMIVKLKTNSSNFDYDDVKLLIHKLNDDRYSMEDYKRCIKIYLCKILLEKFYLYEIGKIDLFDDVQKKDSYLKYLKLLKNADKIKE